MSCPTLMLMLTCRASTFLPSHTQSHAEGAAGAPAAWPHSGLGRPSVADPGTGLLGPFLSRKAHQALQRNPGPVALTRDPAAAAVPPPPRGLAFMTHRVSTALSAGAARPPTPCRRPSTVWPLPSLCIFCSTVWKSPFFSFLHYGAIFPSSAQFIATLPLAHLDYRDGRILPLLTRGKHGHCAPALEARIAATVPGEGLILNSIRSAASPLCIFVSC